MCKNVLEKVPKDMETIHDRVSQRRKFLFSFKNQSRWLRYEHLVKYLAMEKGQKVQQSNLNLKSLFKMQRMETKTMLSYVRQVKARDTKKSTYCLVVVIERNQLRHEHLVEKC